MPERVEPPILLSRLLTLVFAAAVVMTVALGVTLYKLFPLNRPQVFFLTGQPRNNIELRLHEMPVDDENLDIYKRTFIREYIRARNEIVANTRIMRKKWNNVDDGVVFNWSTDDIYAAFQETNMWIALMNDVPDFEFTCSVEFRDGAIEPYADDTYLVSFSYFCADNNGQTDTKDYKIKVRLESTTDARIKWADRVDNPLGMRVAEYQIVSDNGDPLDTGYLQ